MPDVSHLWGNDLVVSPHGDIATVDGDSLTEQRIIRRLMTAVRGYIFNLNYGAGLPERIGSVFNLDEVTGVIREQIALEGSVARLPLPQITVVEIANGVSVTIVYYSAFRGTQKSISFEVTQ